jgi:hypothetical protein
LPSTRSSVRNRSPAPLRIPNEINHLRRLGQPLHDVDFALKLSRYRRKVDGCTKSGPGSRFKSAQKPDRVHRVWGGEGRGKVGNVESDLLRTFTRKCDKRKILPCRWNSRGPLFGVRCVCLSNGEILRHQRHAGGSLSVARLKARKAQIGELLGDARGGSEPGDTTPSTPSTPSLPFSTQ